MAVEAGVNAPVRTPKRGHHIWAAFLNLGKAPIPYAEMVAYAAAVPSLRDPWEFETLAQMSRAYSSELAQGSDPFRLAPIDRDKL